MGLRMQAVGKQLNAAEQIERQMPDRIHQLLLIDDSMADVGLFKEALRTWKTPYYLHVVADGCRQRRKSAPFWREEGRHRAGYALAADRRARRSREFVV